MRNKRLIIALLAAILFGLIAAFSVKQYLLMLRPTQKSQRRCCCGVEIPSAPASFLSTPTLLSFRKCHT